jgi:anaerobic ribonucleoside-triphosphate reductase
MPITGKGMSEENKIEVEKINDEIKILEEKLLNCKGTETEVYSRIVGYYRNTRNWNPGKAREFDERRTFYVKNVSKLRTR